MSGWLRREWRSPTDRRSEGRCAEVVRLPLRSRKHAKQGDSRDCRAEQLRDPVEKSQPQGDLPTDEGAESHGRIKMPARDVCERGRHDAYRESVRKSDEKEVCPARGDNRSRADENQCKRPSELGNPLPPRGDRHLAAPPAA